MRNPGYSGRIQVPYDVTGKRQIPTSSDNDFEGIEVERTTQVAVGSSDESYLAMLSDETLERMGIR